MMKSRFGAGVSVVFLALYAFFYAGWFFHESARPVVFSYSVRHLLVLAVLSLPLGLPSLSALVIRRVGGRRVAFALAPAVALLAVAYIGSGYWYYYTQAHPFDPILQVAPPDLSGYPTTKQRDVFRVLALGGSTTENSGLAAKDRYPHQLQTLLQQRMPSKRVEVINAGMGWYTTQHSLINYVTYCRRWSPDLVVVMHGINDLYRSFEDPTFSVGRYNDRWSHFYGPSIHGARPPPFEVWLYRKTPINRHWYRTLRVHAEDMPVDRYVSIGAFESNLRSLADVVRADHIPLVVVTQPTILKAEMRKAELPRLRFGREHSVVHDGFWNQTYASPKSMHRAMAAYAGVVRKVAREEGVVLADASAVVPRDLHHFTDDVHYTWRGARAVAVSVAGAIWRAGILDAESTR